MRVLVSLYTILGIPCLLADGLPSSGHSGGGTGNTIIRPARGHSVSSGDISKEDAATIGRLLKRIAERSPISTEKNEESALVRLNHAGTIQALIEGIARGNRDDSEILKWNAPLEALPQMIAALEGLSAVQPPLRYREDDVGTFSPRELLGTAILKRLRINKDLPEETRLWVENFSYAFVRRPDVQTDVLKKFWELNGDAILAKRFEEARKFPPYQIVRSEAVEKWMAAQRAEEQLISSRNPRPSKRTPAGAELEKTDRSSWERVTGSHILGALGLVGGLGWMVWRFIAAGRGKRRK